LRIALTDRGNQLRISLLDVANKLMDKGSFAYPGLARHETDLTLASVCLLKESLQLSQLSFTPDKWFDAHRSCLTEHQLPDSRLVKLC
jgi:hypothetical protein